MERLGIQSLQQALEGRTERDLEESLKRHLRRLEAAEQNNQDQLFAPPQAEVPPPAETRKEERQEPLSDLFLALCESVAQTYVERQRPDSAMKVVWEAFATRPR